jgi:hypothetical protein
MSKCFDKFELGDCPVHTDKPDWCKKDSLLGEIIVFSILGPTMFFLLIVILYAITRGAYYASKWFYSKMTDSMPSQTMKLTGKQEAYIGEPLKVMAQYNTYKSATPVV